MMLAIALSGQLGCGRETAIVPNEATRSVDNVVSVESVERENDTLHGDTESSAWFNNVAAESGLDQPIYCGGKAKNHILESTGSGIAWVDYDEDGLLDVLVLNAWQLDDVRRAVSQKGPRKLYRNTANGKFVDVTEEAGLAGSDWSSGVCAGDYDNDGHVDLYLTGFGENRLYRHNGRNGYEEVAVDAGVVASGWSTGAAFFDADGDGWLDLYVAKYIDSDWNEVLQAERTSDWQGRAVMAGPFGMRGGQDVFYKNNRDGTFSDQTAAAGMGDTAESYGLGVLASDLDADGDVDLYVANDSNSNFVYRNEGDGTFKEIGGWNGAGNSGDGRPQGSMGVDAGDFTGDGLQDLLVTNFAQDYCTIYKNEGRMFFSDVSNTLRMSEFTRGNLSWGCAYLDFDADGYLDVLIVNGHIYPQVDEPNVGRESYRQRPTLLRQLDGEFINVSDQAGPGMQQLESMRGLAVADYNLDGKLDLLVTAIDSPPLLLRNETKSAGHWITVRVSNTFGSPALNAVVTIKAGGRSQVREVRSGSCYCSQNDFDLHFGLGDATQVELLEVRFLSGKILRLSTLPTDRVHHVHEPNQDSPAH